MVIEISDETMRHAGLTGKELKLMLAVQLFAEEKVTLAAASKLAEMHEVEFQKELANRNIPIHYDVDDFLKDIVTISSIKQ